MNYQYYYKVNECNAKTSTDKDCICWHNEGARPFKDEKQTDQVPMVSWRLAPPIVINKEKQDD